MGLWVYGYMSVSVYGYISNLNHEYLGHKLTRKDTNYLTAD